MDIPYTAATVGAVLLIMQLVFMISTGTHRGKKMIGVGVGEDKDLERKMRRHGNLVENAAIFIVVLALTEGILGGGVAVTAFGALFVLARFSHAAAFSSLEGSHGVEGGSKLYLRLRMAGALGTSLCGIGLSLYLLFSLYV